MGRRNRSLYRFEGDFLRTRILAASVFLLLVFVIGTFGYHILEGITLFDGFYMTFITITTIGFSEVKHFSTGGRILTIVLAIFGIGSIAYMASQTTQAIFESELILKRALRRKLERMQNHHIICGYGRIGRRIAEVLAESEIELVVVDNRPEIINRLKERGIPFVEGDAREEETLKRAGIDKARGLVCTLSNDEVNVFVTLIAREMNSRVFIMVRTNQQQNTRKILRAGADKVISPYEIGADRMANVILRPNVELFVDRIVKYTDEEHFFEEVLIAEGSTLHGKTIAEADVRSKYNLMVIAIIPAETGKIMFNPGSRDMINIGDILIVLGERERIGRMRKEVCADHRTLADRAAGADYLKLKMKSGTTDKLKTE